MTPRPTRRRPHDLLRGSRLRGRPTGRAGLKAVRTRTVIAFAFNALVIAMTVSLISGLIATYDG